MIVISNIHNINKATLTMYDGSNKIIETQAFIGKNGTTANKVEGDGKTPEGIFALGVVFGTHSPKKVKLNKSIKYVQINENLYWVDDPKSAKYNQLVDITKTQKDWDSAEHLIDYPMQYEYAIEIKANPNNIPGMRKCNFSSL